MSGIDYPRVHAWTQGGGVSLSNARKLAKALGVPLLKILWEARWFTTEELGERIHAGGKMALDDHSTEDLLAEAQRRVAAQKLRQTM